MKIFYSIAQYYSEIILMVQQNYISDLSSKILDPLARSFFLCMYVQNQNIFLPLPYLQ